MILYAKAHVQRGCQLLLVRCGNGQVPKAQRSGGCGQEEPKAQPDMEGRKGSKSSDQTGPPVRLVKPASLMLETNEMATSEDGGDGACFVSPTMLEFKLLEQSAEAALGTFSGYLAADGK